MRSGRDYPQITNHALAADALDHRWLALSYAIEPLVYITGTGFVSLDRSAFADGTIDLATASVTYGGHVSTGVEPYTWQVVHWHELPGVGGNWRVAITLDSGGGVMWRHTVDPFFTYFRAALYIGPGIIESTTAPVEPFCDAAIFARPYEQVPPYWPYG